MADFERLDSLRIFGNAVAPQCTTNKQTKMAQYGQSNELTGEPDSISEAGSDYGVKTCTDTRMRGGKKSRSDLTLSSTTSVDSG